MPEESYEVRPRVRAPVAPMTGPRVVAPAARGCVHTAEGHRVQARSGLVFQWCSRCGALGVGRQGEELVWIRPGDGAEDQIMDLVSSLR